MRGSFFLATGAVFMLASGIEGAWAQSVNEPALKSGVDRADAEHTALCHNAAERRTFLLDRNDLARKAADEDAQRWYKELSNMAADGEAVVQFIANASMDMASRLVESGDSSNAGILAVADAVTKNCGNDGGQSHG